MAGQYADDETGLFYNYYRFYDPKTGRYVTSDPLGLTDGTNPYNYVYGNPLSYVDPTGEYGVGGAVGGAIFSTGMQIVTNFFATGGDVKRSLLCIDLADIALSAALGAAGPTALGDIVLKKNAVAIAQRGGVLTAGQIRAQNVLTYATKVQPTSVATKSTFDFTVDDLRRKFSDDECDDAKCDDIVMPEKLRFLNLLQF